MHEGGPLTLTNRTVAIAFMSTISVDALELEMTGVDCNVN
jgi:hypothetical protein